MLAVSVGSIRGEGGAKRGEGAKPFRRGSEKKIRPLQ